MEQKLKRNGERLSVKLGGRLDAHSAPALEKEMAEEFEGVSDVVFDLSELEYISSAGLRILLASFKLMDKRGGTMRVESAGEDVMGVLKMSGFASIFGVDS